MRLKVIVIFFVCMTLFCSVVSCSQFIHQTTELPPAYKKRVVLKMREVPIADSIDTIIITTGTLVKYASPERTDSIVINSKVETLNVLDDVECGYAYAYDDNCLYIATFGNRYDTFKQNVRLKLNVPERVIVKYDRSLQNYNESVEPLPDEVSLDKSRWRNFSWNRIDAEAEE